MSADECDALAAAGKVGGGVVRIGQRTKTKGNNAVACVVGGGKGCADTRAIYIEGARVGWVGQACRIFLWR